MSALPEKCPLSRRIRFGDFEADVRTGELLKRGKRVPVQKQPFDALVALLERAGELVSRDEVQRAIFVDGVNVDFEHSVNRAISKLRNALGDSADHPRMIETLQGRGYRFIAPVNTVSFQNCGSHDSSLAAVPISNDNMSRGKSFPLPCHGALPLDSPFYIEREVDGKVHLAVEVEDTVVLLKGARQTGKTSLLARVLARSRERGEQVVVTDIQKIEVDKLTDIDSFLRAVASPLADSLEIASGLETAWDPRRSACSNFERFLCRTVCTQGKRIVWAIDEADRVFPRSYASEFFGLLRAWHNERALDPDSSWQRLTIVIAYATEAHLFIADPNQSPFNVGSKFELLDFTREQIATLNCRYGSPVDEAGISELQNLLGGHPQLMQRALYELASEHYSLDELTGTAASEDGPFAEHLRHLLLSIERRPELVRSVQGMLAGSGTMSTDHFYRLRAFGVLSGDRARDAVPRCNLYRDFLSRHLL